MDNVTHSLVGYVTSKALVRNPSRTAVIASVIAANAPDADIITLLGDRWTYLHHHRGITHSIIGTACISLLIATTVYLLESRRHQVDAKARAFAAFLMILVSGASHPLMDWTNNYGVRPFLPFDSSWIYGDILFIVDPILWLLLGGVSFLLARSRRARYFWIGFGAVAFGVMLLMLTRRVELTPSPLFYSICLSLLFAIACLYKLKIGQSHSQKLSSMALILLIVYCLSIFIVQKIARAGAADTARRISSEPIREMATMPAFASAFRWRNVADTPSSVLVFETDLNGESDKPTEYKKPTGEDLSVVSVAEKDRAARIFLNFARFPLAKVEQTSNGRVVHFCDLRYTTPGQRRGFYVDVLVPNE
jgi:inner membrane protein